MESQTDSISNIGKKRKSSVFKRPDSLDCLSNMDTNGGQVLVSNETSNGTFTSSHNHIMDTAPSRLQNKLIDEPSNSPVSWCPQLETSHDKERDPDSIGKGESDIITKRIIAQNAEEHVSRNILPTPPMATVEDHVDRRISSFLIQKYQSEQTKSKALYETLAITYIIFLLITGVTCYLLEIQRESASGLSEIFNICLLSVQMAWLLIMVFAVRQSKKKLMQAQANTGSDGDETSCGDIDKRTEEGDFKDFLFGRDEVSTFGKIGAIVLAFGNLLHVGMRLADNVYYLRDDEMCTSSLAIVMNSLQILSISYQIFFAVKFSNVIVNKWLPFCKFGIIHCVGTGLCFSLYSIIDEIIEILYKSDLRETSSTNSTSGLNNTDPPLSYINSNLFLSCSKATPLSSTLMEIEPYLYPFSVQMNLIMVGFWIVFWQGIGKTEKLLTVVDENLTLRNIVDTRMFLSADCHASNRGFFSGLITIISAIIILILYNYMDWTSALMMNYVWQLSVYILMISSTLIAFYDTLSLDVREKIPNIVVPFCQYIGLPFLVMHSFFLFIPYTHEEMVLQMIVNMLRIFQGIIQTVFIVVTQRRCANTDSGMNRKPGREHISFLIIANISMWLMMAFQIKCDDACDVLYNFYGTDIMAILRHSFLSLTLFYRFHSSICLVGIWMNAYQPDTLYEIKLPPNEMKTTEVSHIT